ncbi:CRIB domain-containing protein [Ancistrocladus abbreviatus]
MKDHIERWIILPFSTGCASKSSIAVATNGQLKSVPETNFWHLTQGRQAGEKSSFRAKKKNSFVFLALPKSKISHGLRRLISSLSHLFAYKYEIEEEELEMEIGFPTDVKHVTHIGWDGSTTTNPVKGWENLSTSEIISFPSISLRQFELAMAAQAASETQLLV